MNFKIGVGYDIHRLENGRKLILGGIEIPHDKGLVGHSDADVLIHAISDAILGSLGQQNIGELFPNTVDWTKNLESKKILHRVLDISSQLEYKICNIDAVIIAQFPKLSPFLVKIRHSLADILNMQFEDVNVKVKTNEMIGEIGEGNAIAVIANVLISRICEDV